MHQPLLRRVSIKVHNHMAVGQNQWYQFGVGAPPILVFFSGDWDVHWGNGLLTHDHMGAKLWLLLTLSLRAHSYSARSLQLVETDGPIPISSYHPPYVAAKRELRHLFSLWRNFGCDRIRSFRWRSRRVTVRGWFALGLEIFGATRF